MKTVYRIERFNGQPSRMAETRTEAVSIAEAWVGRELHQGATDYTVDYGDADGNRCYGYATDFWIDPAHVSREMSVPADVVITEMTETA